MITLEKFNPNNRNRRIGNSFYQICLDEKTKQWYINECFSTSELCYGKAFYGSNLEQVINILNGFSMEKEVISRCQPENPKVNRQEKEQVAETMQEEIPAASVKKRLKPMTISQELFKQMIFDILMESQDQVSEDANRAILDILNRYDVGSPWRRMSSGKPASGEYFFIRLNSYAEYRDPSWLEKPLLAKRVKGGFHVSGLLVPDQEVGAYSEIHMPA